MKLQRAALVSAFAVQLFPSVSFGAEATSKTTLAGPVVEGMCVLSRADVFAASRVAQSVNAKYRAAFENAQNAVTKEREALEAEARNLQAKKSTLKAEELQKLQSELTERVKALQGKANEQTQVLETTRRDVAARIAIEAQPLIEQVYNERGCGLLLSREAVLAGNVEMDITAAVIAALDRKLTDLPFEHAPTASSAAR